MTRWARSKSILKHERQPGKATTWSEFVAQRQQPMRQQQREGATKQGSAQGSSETSGLTIFAGKASEDKAIVSIQAKSTNLNAAVVVTADSDAACTEKTATKSNAQASQRSIRSKVASKVKGKGVVKKRTGIVDDKEAELLAAVLRKHAPAELGVTAVQQATGVAPQERPATVPQQSMAAENAASRGGDRFTKKTMKAKSPSMNRKTQPARRKNNACALENALPAVEKQLSLSGESEVHSGTKKVQSPAMEKRKGAAKRTITSAKEEIPPSDEKQRKVKNPFPKKKRAVKRKALSKEAATVPVEGKPPHEGGNENQVDAEDGQPAPKQIRTGPRIGGGRKAEWLQRLRQEREAKGILLLPEKVERRIYLAKKAMRKKGLPEEQIKDAVRKRRRKEELLFRRQLSKLCFKCRQPGHKVADCPQMLQDSSEAVGICFKCGSTEHFSSACIVQTSKDNEFPYAKCFICKQQGHLSRKCPRNEKGAYPKGGHCNFCGAIDHFKSECPELDKNKKNKGNEEIEIAADIASMDQSADAENIVPLGQQSHGNKAKVVSF